MGESIRKVALFDFDGTLSRRDCLVPFLWRCVGPIEFARAFARSAHFLVPMQRDSFKASLLWQIFHGKRADEVSDLGEKFGRDIVSHRLRPDTLERLQWHLGQGHEVLFVSASLAVYLDTVGRLLDVTTVIAVELESDEDGILTGRMVGGNVRARRKVELVKQYLAGPRVLEGDAAERKSKKPPGPPPDTSPFVEESAVNVEPCEIWAYGNSDGDKQLLEFADHPVWVSRYQNIPTPVIASGAKQPSP